MRQPLPPDAPVYPRWRGEHQQIYGVDGHCSRFIPAGAGNTCQRRLRLHQRPVYPRWRGEHRLRMTAAPLLSGLSPLARGTHSWRVYVRNSGRFIPAGAGNTSRYASTVAPGAVYPRWRGEHPTVPLTQRSVAGLSPLARGTHLNYTIVFYSLF